jgi:hypothetical protein
LVHKSLCDVFLVIFDAGPGSRVAPTFVGQTVSLHLLRVNAPRTVVLVLVFRITCWHAVAWDVF